MNVLAVVHGSNVPPGSFGGEAERRGHQVDEWSLAWSTPPPLPVDDYDAVMVFGGSMHADQDDRHPWLREENLFIQRLLDTHVPLLGVCLGAQLIAKAAGAPVRLMPEPEIGWVEVELTEAGREDEVLARLPERFHAFQWHYYDFGLPAGAHELARSRACAQAFRLGEVAWGLQFHPEVTGTIVRRWLDEEDAREIEDAQAFLSEFDERASEWESIGQVLSGGFLELVERRVAVAV